MIRNKIIFKVFPSLTVLSQNRRPPEFLVRKRTFMLYFLLVFSATLSEKVDSFVTKQCVMNKMIHLKSNEKIIVRSQSDLLLAKRIGPTNRADEQGRRLRRGWHFKVRGKCIDTNLRSKAEPLV